MWAHHAPSQARTKNSSSWSILCVVISGSAVTICFSASREKFCLNSKSPMARDSARLPGVRGAHYMSLRLYTPLTRPNSTNPPADVIRVVSSVCQLQRSHQPRRTHPCSSACGRTTGAWRHPCGREQTVSLRHWPVVSRTHGRGKRRTHHNDPPILGDQAHHSRASRRVVEEVGIWGQTGSTV